MSEGYMGEENYNEIEENVEKAKNMAAPIADKAIDKTANKLADHFGNKSDKNSSLNIDKPDKTKNLLNEAKKNNKDAFSELGKGVKSGLNGDKQGAKDHLKNAAANRGKAIGNTAKAGVEGLKSGNIAAGLGDKAADAIKNTGRINNGRASGDVVDGVTDAAVDAGKTAIKAGVAAGRIAASGGTDVAAWIDLLKSGILKWVLFAALLLIAPIFILIFAMGGMISEALTKLSEAFTAVSEALNPTEYDNFSMENQYEILAKAFGDEVFRAYELMIEDVDKEIDTYANNVTYNEWQKILDWNKEKGQIDYTLIYSSSDAAANIGEQGMPDANVYIGGYQGDIEDDSWGVTTYPDGDITSADNSSKTDPNFNKGLLKEGKALGEDSCYATGNEVYFDANEVKEAVRASAGYAAVSDMAYLVAGYNVSMMEAPIIDFGTQVSALKAGSTILKYKADIGIRIFSNTVDNYVDKYGGGIWGNIVGRLEGVAAATGDLLKNIFNGESTYFTYDAALIEVISNPMTRTVYEYDEQLYTVQEYQYTYKVSYKDNGCECNGHTHSHVSSGCTQSVDTSKCSKNSHTMCTYATCGFYLGSVCSKYHEHNDSCKSWSCGKSETTEYCSTTGMSSCTNKSCPGHTDNDITRRHSHDEYLSDYTHDSTPSYSGNDFIEDIKNAYSGYNNVVVTWTGTTAYGNSYQINRSEYAPTEKQYTKYTLDIPMSAFDVDRILKALFETSPYYGEITYYYTDHSATYGSVVGETADYTPPKIDGSQDEILEKYGRYVAKWKYAYFADASPTQYTSYDGTIWEHSYAEGELYENGIDSQPYFQQDEVYIYNCGHGKGYGISVRCPDCGQASVQRSSDIKAIGEEGTTYYGSGNRPLTYIGTTLVQQGGYFTYILGMSEFGEWLSDINRELKQNTMIAMTTTDKLVIDDYTGGQVGGTVGFLSGASNVGAGVDTGDGEGSTEDLEGTTPVTTLVGSSNTEKTWNFLIGKGLTPAQAAGVMGNIQGESSFNPGAFNPGGGGQGAYGICQWRADRQTALRTYCSTNGFSYASLEGQLNYLWYELQTSEHNALVRLRATTTAIEASNSFGANFERFGDHPNVYTTRARYSNSFLATNGLSAGAASYSGDGVEGMTGGSIGATASSQIHVILVDAYGDEYYPITVLERVLAVKDSALNVLENCDQIQADLAARGLTYDQRYGGQTAAIAITPMAEYVAGVVRDETGYTNITILANGEISIGLGNWQGDEAVRLLNSIIDANPDAYRQACEDAGIEELQFTSNWNSTSNPDYGKYRQVISVLLDLGHSEQNAMFNEKVQNVVSYFINYHVTDPATLALLSASAMYFEDVNDLSSAGGTMAIFREYVMVGSINAGADNSFETAHSMLSAWLNQSGNEYSSYAIRNKLEVFYSVIKEDNENDRLPWIGTGELTPENVQPIIDLATTMTMDGYKDKFTYSQSGRYTIPRFAETLMSMYNTGTGEIVGDCSSFVAALYYCFGYNVPTSSGAWKGNSYGYVQRTDMDNMIPGDVIVWRNSNSGHVEIYIGNGQSIGFGSEPPKIHTNWNCFPRYSTVSYYRIVE